MANPFSLIPPRFNGEKISYSWFETLKAAGIAMGFSVLQTYTNDAAFVAAKGGAAAEGDSYFNTTLHLVRVYANGSWRALGSGGGGAGFTWKPISGTAPVDAEEFGEVVWNFSAQQAQELYATVKVPQSYNAGTPIIVYVSAYSPSTSGTILLLAQSTLIRPGTTAFGSTSNQRTTSNTAITNVAPANLLQQFALDITDTVGAISSVPVQAGDVIKVRLYRDNSDTDTADLRMIPNSTDIKSS